MKTSSLILTLWPKKQNDNLLFKVGKVASLVTIKHKIIKNWVHNTLDEDQRFDLHLWSPNLKMNIEYLLSRGNLRSNLSLSSKKVLIVEQTTFFHRQADWPRPLIMWQKIKWEHLFSRDIHCTKFCNFLAKRSSRQHFFKDQQFDLTSELRHENQNSHLLLMGIHCFKFGKFQGKASKDIEKRSYTAPSLATFKKRGQ